MATASVTPQAAVAEIDRVGRRFKDNVALSDVSLTIRAGEIHALLGPNGAGKTTLLRMLGGLLEPTTGSVRVLGCDAARGGRRLRRLVGVVPAGDRTLYLRISGLENLVFFGRLQGMRRRAAVERALEVLADVDLLDAARRPVGLYSHGMQKRLLLARALLTDPALLLVDEATHDLDPAAARQARELVAATAARGVAVLWTTQRLEEVRGFAVRVTLLSKGSVRFCGTVPDLMDRAAPRRFVVRLSNCEVSAAALIRNSQQALGPLAEISPASGDGSEHFVLSLGEGVVLGDAVTALTARRIQVVSCREERHGIEDAFLTLTEVGA